jgi:hypothetical protein
METENTNIIVIDCNPATANSVIGQSRVCDIAEDEDEWFGQTPAALGLKQFMADITDEYETCVTGAATPGLYQAGLRNKYLTVRFRDRAGIRRAWLAGVNEDGTRIGIDKSFDNMYGAGAAHERRGQG